MKVYQRHLNILKFLNLFSLLAISVTIFYCWYILRPLADVVQVPKEFASVDLMVIDKRLIWEDIRLMVISYLLLSLVTVFMELTPFRQSSGFHKAQFVSIINLCISVVFAYTIIHTVSLVVQ